MAVTTLVPLDEYISTSFEPDHEYVDGRLVARNVGELDHSYLQYLIAKLLDQRGLLPFTELRVQVGPSRFRIPDVLALRGERPNTRFLRQPPYIVVEIVSRDDRAGDLADKLDDYFAFGVENVWFIDPRRRTVTVHTRNIARLCSGHVETTDGAISISLDEIFRNMPTIEDEA
jgi:Uma2 family endonuclease